MEPEKITITFTVKEGLITSCPNKERFLEDVTEMIDKFALEREVELIGSGYNLLTNERDFHYEAKVM